MAILGDVPDELPPGELIPVAVTVDDLRVCSQLVADLSDPEIMRRAWS